MQYKQYSIEMDLTGLTGKKIAEVLSDCFSSSVGYDGSAGMYTVMDNFERLWIVGRTDGIICQRKNGDKIQGANPLFASKLKTPMLIYKDFCLVETVLNRLNNAGAITNDTTSMAIVVDVKGHYESYRKNILNIMQSKGELIYKALQTNNPTPPDFSGFDEEGIIRFPMFNSDLSEDKIKSCLQLVLAINNQAMTQKNISPKPNDSPNEKFTFRTWLTRLGMNGPEFKTARTMLMESLEGNTAWKNPELADRYKEKLSQDTQEIGLSEEQEGSMSGMMM